MSESDIKQVVVALSHPDELNPRRRRRTRKFKDDVDSQLGGGAEPAPVGVVDATGTVQTNVTVQKEIPVQTTTVSAIPGALPVTSTNPVQTVTPVLPTPSLSSVAMVGGGVAAPTVPAAAPGAVHIREKKITQPSGTAGTKLNTLNALNAPVSSPPHVSMPKIIPHKKRLTNAPVAQTLKKPKFVIAPKNDTISGETGSGGMHLKPMKGAASTHGRKFTERKIKIEVKHTVKTRKSRKVLKERIESMPIQAVRRLLIKKGILKPKATVPPEPMMRSMLHDYYLLKQSE